MYYYCVVKIYVCINATAQEVFSICIKPLGVLYGVVQISVGINATAQEVFSICIKPLGVLYGVVQISLGIMPRLDRCSPSL